MPWPCERALGRARAPEPSALASGPLSRIAATGRRSGTMERGLYIAAAGMVAEMARQDQIANDLANAATPGYKADRSQQRSFSDLLLQNTKTGQAIGPLGSGPVITKQVTDFEP